MTTEQKRGEGALRFCECGAATIPTKAADFQSDDEWWECSRCFRPLDPDRIPEFFRPAPTQGDPR